MERAISERRANLEQYPGYRRAVAEMERRQRPGSGNLFDAKRALARAEADHNGKRQYHERLSGSSSSGISMTDLRAVEVNANQRRKAEILRLTGGKG